MNNPKVPHDTDSAKRSPLGGADPLSGLRVALRLQDREKRACAVREACDSLAAARPSPAVLGEARELLRPWRMATVLDSAVRADRASRREASRQAASAGRQPVNVTTEGFFWDHDKDSGQVRLYQAREDGPPAIFPVPYLKAVALPAPGSGDEAMYVLAPDSLGSADPVIVPADDIETGRYAAKLRMPRTPDRKIREAIATVVLFHQHEAAPSGLAAPSAGDLDDTGRLRVRLPEALPAGYLRKPPGRGDEELAAAWREVNATVARNPLLALLEGLSVAGPYVPALHRESAVIHGYGPSGLGKTTGLLLGGAVWGKVSPPKPEPGTTVRSWNRTALSTPQQMGVLGILPAFTDEMGTSGFTPAERMKLVYQLAGDASRMRARRHGFGTEESPGWGGITFTSGNEALYEPEEATGPWQGIPARCLQFEAPFTRDADDAGILARLLPGAYGWLGPAVLAAVTVPDMAELIAKAEADLDMPAGGVPQRVARVLAAGVAGAMAADRVAGGEPIASAALEAARDYLEAHRAGPLPDGHRVLALIAEDKAFHPSAWASREAAIELRKPYLGWSSGTLPQHGQDRELHGYFDDEHVYVSPGFWKEATARARVPGSSAAGELYRAGHLIVPASLRRRGEWASHLPRWVSGSGAAYKIRLSALAASDDDSTAPGPGPDAGLTPLEAALKACLDVASGDREVGAVLAALEAVAQAKPARPEPEKPEPVQPEPARAVPLPPLRISARERNVFKGPRATGQYEALDRATEALDAGRSLRLLAALEGSKGQPGPYAPLRYGKQPYWSAEPPAIASAAHVPDSWSWQRDYDGPAVVLDRNAAFLASMASADMAHGKLEPSGPVDDLPSSGLRPGYYQVNVYPWPESGAMPSPLGNRKPGTQCWVPQPLAALLRDLAREGRWPDSSALDSVTADPCRLDDWAHFIAEIRRYALERYGRDSEPYQAVKDEYGQAIALIQGSWAGEGASMRREWTCYCHRGDWAHHVKAHSAAMMWRAADKCRQAGEGLGPVALRDVDSLVIPADALGLVTGLLRIDQSGISLGSFKVKGEGRSRGA